MRSVAIHPIRRRAITLLEVLLVAALLAVIAGVAIPTFMRQVEASHLPESSQRMRALITMVRARAAFEGKRYRIRFPMPENQDDQLFDPYEPIVEREDNALVEPEVFNRVEAPWLRGETFLGKVRCLRVRLGKPRAETILDEMDEVEDEEELLERFQDFEPERPPLIVDLDGTSEWVTFVLTDAPEDVDFRSLDIEQVDHVAVEVIVDGLTGQIYLQRPLFESELELFAEKGWSIVLRKDFFDKTEITEDQVLELHQASIDQLMQAAEGVEASR